MYDYIIIGQGIAGTMLAWHLIKAQKSVLIFDQPNSFTASYAASGIINPITGKRFLKSWKMDELLPYAVEVYQSMQADFQADFFRQLNIYSILNSNEELNDWSAKANTPAYQQYLSSTSILNLDESKVSNPMGCIEVEGGCKVESVELLQAARKWFIEKNVFCAQYFDETLLQVHDDCVAYQNIKADKIIFANGHQSISSQLFKEVKFVPVKGEALLIKIDDFYTDKMIHGDVLISPTNEKNIYYVGSTYQWDYQDEQPSATRKEELISRIQNTITAPFEVVNHLTGIRPASKDRRPIIGTLPNQPRIGIFNGLGTKGFSLAPFFAKHFCNHLLNHETLFPEVNVKRFF